MKTKIKINKILRQAQDRAGFTLVELLVVISIIGILTIISLASFNNAQIKAKDAQRKSDLNQIHKALMLYFSDSGSFPDIVDFGNVSVGLTGKDGTIYMRQIPQDPKFVSGWKSYFYDVSSSKKSFNLFADLENREDIQCIKADPPEDDVGKWQGDGEDYCFGVASPNTIVGDISI